MVVYLRTIKIIDSSIFVSRASQQKRTKGSSWAPCQHVRSECPSVSKAYYLVSRLRHAVFPHDAGKVHLRRPSSQNDDLPRLAWENSMSGGGGVEDRGSLKRVHCVLRADSMIQLLSQQKTGLMV